MQTTQNPFAEVELMLQRPAADGIFITYLEQNSPFANAGVAVGDIVVAAGEQATLDEKSFYQALQPRDEKDKKRMLRILRGGKQLEIDVPTSAGGYDICAVAKGRSAWDDKPDFQDEPDFSALGDGAECWMRNCFGEEPAGYEHISIRRSGDKIEAALDFRLGGDGKPGKTWEYFTRAATVHRLDRKLSVLKTAFWEGRPEKRRGEVSLVDGIWRGVHLNNGKEENVSYTANSPGVITGYTSTLLSLIMPLREGASLTFFISSDASGIAKGRSRMECIGRRTVTVCGEQVPAWGFAWRHYGNRKPEEDEHYYLNDERELVRIDWGPGYGNCACERMDKERILKSIPKHIL
jgi:hypothetical protein